MKLFYGCELFGKNDFCCLTEVCRYGWLLLVKKLTFDGFRFWKNFLYESCRARWTEFVDIKYTKIGVRMKKLWYKEIELLLRNFLTISRSYCSWRLLFGKFLYCFEKLSFLVTYYLRKFPHLDWRKLPREEFLISFSILLPFFLPHFLFFLLLPLQTLSLRMVFSPLVIFGH